MYRSIYIEPCFLTFIKRHKINTVIEVGSRDLRDTLQMYDYYKCKIYAFECNPFGYEKCLKRYNENKHLFGENITLEKYCVSNVDGEIDFYPFDLEKFPHDGPSSLYIKDWVTYRNPSDPDYNRGYVQKKIKVQSIPLDKYCKLNDIDNIDLLCLDTQGAELEIIKSLNSMTPSYIILEATLFPDYTGGTCFQELYDFLIKKGYSYICSDRYGTNLPPIPKEKCLTEFNALFEFKY